MEGKVVWGTGEEAGGARGRRGEREGRGRRGKGEAIAAVVVTRA